jgi:hypothetical protein
LYNCFQTLFYTCLYCTQRYKTFFFFKELHKIVHNCTTLHNTLHNFRKKCTNTNFTKLNTILHNFSQLYKNLQKCNTLLTPTRLSTTLHIFTNKAIHNFWNYTLLYKVLQNLYTTLENFTILYNTLHKSTKLYNATQWYTILHTITNRYNTLQHKCTTLFTTLHIFTQLYTKFTQLYTSLNDFKQL